MAAVLVADGDQAVLEGSVGLPAALLAQRSFPRDDCPLGPALASGGPVLVEDGRLDAHDAWGRMIAPLGAVAYAGVPLRREDGEVVGCVCALDARPRPWSEGELELLRDFAGMAWDQLRSRSRAEEQGLVAASLRESERTFRSLIENSSDVIAVLSPGGIVHYESPSVSGVLGYAPGELMGKSAWELVHPQEVTSVIQQFTAAAAGVECETSPEIRLRLKDGRWGTFRVRARQARGEVAGGVVVTARDLTARKLAEENQHRLATILEAAPHFVCTLDPHGRALYINPAGRKMLGIEESDVASMTIAELYPRDTTWKVLNEGLPAANHRGSWSADLEFVRTDGELIPVAQVLIAHHSALGAVEFMSILARDIREQKEAEEALRSSEEHFRSLIENASDVVHVMDTEGIIRYVSPSVERVTGYRAEELIGRDGFEIVHPEQRDFARASFAERLAEGDAGPPIEIVVRRKDGEWRTFEMRANDLREDPAIDGVVINSRDVTDRKQTEKALAESQEQLLQSQKMEAVGRLAGGVAHDFNNLLTAIKGFTELLLLDFDEQDPRRSFASEIQGAANRAAGLTRQLLAFSRKQVLQPKVLDLGAVLADMEKMLHRLIGEDVHLQTNTSHPRGRIKADPGQIEQVLLNLVVNARDAMPTGGRLVIETTDVHMAQGQLAVGNEIPEGSYVMLTVRDTGCGMTREVQERIFEPFFTTKGQGKGTGLGLSTVYGIVRQSGGAIAVESEAGVGTTFRIYLPAVQEEPEQRVERAPQASVEGTESVLLVEDEPAVRVLVRRVLGRMGYQVLEAESGPAALAVLEQHGKPIDLLLTDVVMPGMSGRELADELGGRFPDLRVLYMSGYTDEAIVQHGVLEPGVAFLEKPFTPDILLRKVREVIEGPRGAD